MEGKAKTNTKVVVNFVHRPSYLVIPCLHHICHVHRQSDFQCTLHRRMWCLFVEFSSWPFMCLLETTHAIQYNSKSIRPHGDSTKPPRFSRHIWHIKSNWNESKPNHILYVHMVWFLFLFVNLIHYLSLLEYLMAKQSIVWTLHLFCIFIKCMTVTANSVKYCSVYGFWMKVSTIILHFVVGSTVLCPDEVLCWLKSTAQIFTKQRFIAILCWKFGFALKQNLILYFPSAFLRNSLLHRLESIA